MPLRDIGCLRPQQGIGQAQKIRKDTGNLFFYKHLPTIERFFFLSIGPLLIQAELGEGVFTLLALPMYRPTILVTIHPSIHLL